MALTENGGFSIADAMALTKSDNGEGTFGGSSGLWVFFLFFLLAWGGNSGGLFGGNNGSAAATAAVEGMVTRSDLSAALGQQDVFRNQSDIRNELSAFERDATNNWGSMKYDNLQGVNSLQQSLCSGFGGVNTSINAVGANLVNQISENRYAQQLANCQTNQNIDSLKYENTKNTADIIAANAMNTQRVMDMMMQNQVQALRDELSTTRAALSNTMQTQSILGALQPIPRPAYVTGSPYVATNYCGCGV